jgi:hypothetical protein
MGLANKAMNLSERKSIQGRPTMFSARRAVIIYSRSAGYCQRSPVIAATMASA